MKPTTNQIQNKSGVSGTTLTDALNTVEAILTAGVGIGDMLKTVYDPNNNGIVDAAETAPWTGITDKPATYPPSSHSHTKGEVGLGNVDNTADADKPVSTATANALSNKQDTLVSGTNIKTVNGTSVLGSGDIVISGGGGVTDHGALTGLSDDDHTQYHTDARGDARYAQLSALANKQDTLVSGTNIKTINGTSVLGSGNISVTGTTPVIDSLSITYNGDGSVATTTEDGLVKTFAYNADGSINTISWPVGSLTRTETYSYTSGVLTGMTASEV
jgi:hypothetical protein